MEDSERRRARERDRFLSRACASAKNASTQGPPQVGGPCSRLPPAVIHFPATPSTAPRRCWVRFERRLHPSAFRCTSLHFDAFGRISPEVIATIAAGFSKNGGRRCRRSPYSLRR